MISLKINARLLLWSVVSLYSLTLCPIWKQSKTRRFSLYRHGRRSRVKPEAESGCYTKITRKVYKDAPTQKALLRRALFGVKRIPLFEENFHIIPVQVRYANDGNTAYVIAVFRCLPTQVEVSEIECEN